MCGRIRIRKRKVRRRIKKDNGSLPCIREIMILDWMWRGEFSWGRIVYVTLEKEEESMEI
jgi:hypothetical protein